MFVDTHTHLYLDEFRPSPECAVERAIDAGVDKLLFPNVDISTIEPMKHLQSLFPTNIAMAMGLHPTEVGSNWRDDLAIIKNEQQQYPYVAIGEIGIDLYWDKTYRDEQMMVFAEQIRWATERNLPIIIHCRDGLAEVLSVLDNAQTMPRGVFHSFGGSVEDVEQIRRRGDFYFGINGIVTFKNSKLRDVLPTIGLDRILLETDSPYLAPVPFRGKRNESAYLIHTAAYIANCLNVSIEDVATTTSLSANKLFGI